MSKNNFLNHKLLSKTNIALLCVLVMIAGFLISRAALSIAVIVFGANALRDISPREWLKNKWWLAGLGWVGIYALSYFWSDDIPFWKDRVEVKLPVLLLPLAFSYLPAFSKRQLHIFTASVSVMLLLSIGYTMSLVLQDPEYYIHRYYMSNVMPVLAKQDHIRYSLTLACFVVWCIYYWPRLDNRPLKWFIGISIIIIVGFLHFLAARTGLLALYIFLAIWAIYTGWKKGPLFTIGAALLLAAGVFFAIRFTPTLKKRIDYVYYTYQMYKDGERTGLYSDIGRLISYDLAVKIIKDHPLAGVGAGDMQTEMIRGYEKYYPDVAKEQVLLPHNQFMIAAMAGGIVALVLFIIWVFMPLAEVKPGREGVFFFCIWLMLLLPLLIEPMLEVQFGVFVYLFFLLWQRHAMQHAPADDRNDFISSKQNDQLYSNIST